MSRLMRTTIRLDDGLFAETKRYASQSGRTLSGLIETRYARYQGAGGVYVGYKF